jgi:multiple sugar transport system ATP-binding protein
MAEVRYERATRIYAGTDVPAVAALDLRIADGELLVLVGPSGSGKTTALRMLAGLEEVDGGAIYIGEREVTDDPPKTRGVAMVFQNYALYPYLTVAANIAFPLKIAGVKKAERERRVREAAEMLGLVEYLERKPGQLSGGQRQRVAMGRAIVRDASVFLMDEPLSNLDAKLRVQMRADIAALQARLGVTTAYVTHDQAEAMTLGHRVAVLHNGRLQQCDAPRVLYDRPANRFVAGFIGSPAMNFVDVPLSENGSVSLGGIDVPLPEDVRAASSAGGWSDLVLGVRPESLELAPDGIGAEVQVVEDIGADAYVFCVTTIGGVERRLVARSSTRRAPERGARVALRPVAGEAHLFDPVSGARLG